MRNASYRKRLLGDLEQWIAKGWIQPDNADHIRESLPESSGYARLPVILGFLGAILMCFAAMSFVAANWQDIPRIVRLILLITALWSAYGFAYWLHKKEHPYFAEAAILCALGLFGANIMLIAQMYHIDRSPANGVLLWTVGALVTAGLVRSSAALLASFVLMCIWSGTVAGLSSQLFQWQFLLLWIAGLLLSFFVPSRANIHLLILSIAFWMAVNLFTIFDRFDWPAIGVPILIGEIWLMIFAASPFLDLESLHKTINRRTLECYSLIFFLISLYIVQLFDYERGDPDKILTWLLLSLIVVQAILVIPTVILQMRSVWDGFVILAAAILPVAIFVIVRDDTSSGNGLAIAWGTALIILLLSVWSVSWAQKNHAPAVNVFALILFGGEVLYVYFETLGGLLNSSLFFMMGGLIFIALAFGLHRVHKHILQTESFRDSTQ